MKKLIKIVSLPVQILMYLLVHLQTVQHYWLNFVIAYQVINFISAIIVLVVMLHKDNERNLHEVFKDADPYSPAEYGYSLIMRIALFIVMCVNYPVWGTFYFVIIAFFAHQYKVLYEKWKNEQEKNV